MPRVKARYSALAAVSIGEAWSTFWKHLDFLLTDLDLLHFKRGIAGFLLLFHSRLTALHIVYGINHVVALLLYSIALCLNSSSFQRLVPLSSTDALTIQSSDPASQCDVSLTLSMLQSLTFLSQSKVYRVADSQMT